jgi:hypothetical protein
VGVRRFAVAIAILSAATRAGAAVDAGLALAGVYRRDIELDQYNHAVSLAVSPDGAHVYVGSGPSYTLTLARDPATGRLARVRRLGRRAATAPRRRARLGSCRRRPCWTNDGTRYRYVDVEAVPDGIKKLQLTPGNGNAQIQSRLRGATGPALPLTPPVRVQLSSSEGACWEAVYDTSVVNDGVRFKARAD